MKKSILILLVSVFLFSCGNKSQSKQEKGQEQSQVAVAADETVVNVYYFHGKQRCKTCVSVEDVARETIEEAYAGNEKVNFIEIDTSDEQYDNLVNQYEVSWNALIIAKGDNYADITDLAFANAVNSPDVLSDLIKTEVEKRIDL